MTRNLRAVRTEIAPGVFSLAATEHSLRLLIRDRDRAVREVAEIDAQMAALRRSYADARGEMMLPTIERLRRELLG